MHLNLVDDCATIFPDIDQPERYTSARVWRCRYASLSPLSRLRSLQELRILAYPDSTLEPLAELRHLETLEITHLPNVTSLAPLAALTQLRRLTLATLPSWDASSRTTTVESLSPLAKLPALEEVSLFGVRPPDKRVDDLLGIRTLRRARVSKYPKAEADRLNAALASKRSHVKYTDAD